MKKFATLLSVFCLVTSWVMAAPANNYHLLIAPGTVTESAVTLLWDKQFPKDSGVYKISLNGKVAGTTNKTNYTANNLMPGTLYTKSR